MSLGPGVAELMAAEHEVAGILNGVAGLALPRGQCSQGHEGLVGGAGWVDAAQGPIQHGLVERCIEALPELGIHAIDEGVGVEVGLGDKGEDLSRVGLHGHECTPAISKGGFHELLQAEVHGQLNVAAGHGGLDAELSDDATTGGNLDL